MALKNKTRVLAFIDWYLPGFKAGGPIRSLSNMVEQLSDQLDFYIITSNKDLGEEEGYENTPVNKWQPVSHARVMYFEKAPDKKRLLALFNEVAPNYIYFNSLFSKDYALAPLHALKGKLPLGRTIIAPRGMLGEGALRIKGMKKKVFLGAAKSMGLFKNIKWHASTNQEKKEIQTVFKSANVHVALNLIAPPTVKAEDVLPLKPENKRFIFASRIALKKNLHYLFNCLNMMTFQDTVEVVIYGVIDEASYWDGCKKILNNDKVKMNYKGAVKPLQLAEAMQRAHFFVLPSSHENFGHAVYEAMANGCPVLISDQTAWHNLQDKGVGFDLSLDDEPAWRQAINHMVTMSPREYNTMVGQSISYAREIADDKNAIVANLALFGSHE